MIKVTKVINGKKQRRQFPNPQAMVVRRELIIKWKDV